jgi:hypothetical protein
MHCPPLLSSAPAGKRGREREPHLHREYSAGRVGGQVLSPPCHSGWWSGRGASADHGDPCRNGGVWFAPRLIQGSRAAAGWLRGCCCGTRTGAVFPDAVARYLSRLGLPGNLAPTAETLARPSNVTAGPSGCGSAHRDGERVAARSIRPCPGSFTVPPCGGGRVSREDAAGIAALDLRPAFRRRDSVRRHGARLRPGADQHRSGPGEKGGHQRDNR